MCTDQYIHSIFTNLISGTGIFDLDDFNWGKSSLACHESCCQETGLVKKHNLVLTKNTPPTNKHLQSCSLPGWLHHNWNREDCRNVPSINPRGNSMLFLHQTDIVQNTGENAYHHPFKTCRLNASSRTLMNLLSRLLSSPRWGFAHTPKERIINEHLYDRKRWLHYG